MAWLKSPFIARRWQVATYLLGVALFSISFLVFLNSSVAFVITNLIGRRKGVGNAAGTLGFADELVAIVACPVWGIISDRLGVRWVCTLGYAVVGLSLFLFVQAGNVYPQLLLLRMLFSVGGAATATMVTAVLPLMTGDKPVEGSQIGSHRPDDDDDDGDDDTDYPVDTATLHESGRLERANTSQVAGYVGMFTGFGALIALGAFLPLPARFEAMGQSPEDAVRHSFYIVGVISFAVAAACFVGLASVAGEERKGWRMLVASRDNDDQDNNNNNNNDSNNMPDNDTAWKSSASASSTAVVAAAATARRTARVYAGLFAEALKLGLTDPQISLGYIGGFVARASSVAVSLFISLYVNHHFIVAGRCSSGNGHDGTDTGAGDPSDIKRRCRDAYVLASALAGAAEATALVCAPVFGYLDGRYGRRRNAPLVGAALAGVAAYAALALTKDPDPHSPNGSKWIFAIMALIGVNQIGFIVCSLSALSRGIQANGKVKGEVSAAERRRWRRPRRRRSVPAADEGDALLEGRRDLENHDDNDDDGDGDGDVVRSRGAPSLRPRDRLKGSIAGVYSFGGGLAILLLTKVGGKLFDSVSPGAPFWIMAGFNALALIPALGTVATTRRSRSTASDDDSSKRQRRRR